MYVNKTEMRGSICSSIRCLLHLRGLACTGKRHHTQNKLNKNKILVTHP